MRDKTQYPLLGSLTTADGQAQQAQQTQQTWLDDGHRLDGDWRSWRSF